MRNRTKRRGFSLVEIMVALTILMIIILGLANTTISFLHETTLDTVRVRAQSFADMRIAEVRGYPTYDNPDDNLQQQRRAGARLQSPDGGGARQIRDVHLQQSGRVSEEQCHARDGDRSEHQPLGTGRTNHHHFGVLGVPMQFTSGEDFRSSSL